jgi:hypothetical protein
MILPREEGCDDDAAVLYTIAELEEVSIICDSFRFEKESPARGPGAYVARADATTATPGRA